MIKKFLKYALLLFSFSLCFIASAYFFKIYLLKEPIIVENYFSKNDEQIISFLSKKIKTNKNQLKIGKIRLEINDFQNFVSFNISNINILNNLKETVLKSNKINIRISFLDLIDSFINNESLLLKDVSISEVDVEDFKFLDKSLKIIFQNTDNQRNNQFKNIKINHLNFKLKDKNLFISDGLNFKCKNPNLNFFTNKVENLLNCNEKSSNSNIIIKNFDFKKNDFFLDGYIEKFDLSNLNLKTYFKNFQFNGKIHAKFKINFNKNFQIKKIDFNFLENSKIFKTSLNEENLIQLKGYLSWELFDKKLFIKDFVMNKININGIITQNDSKFLSNLKLNFNKIKLNDLHPILDDDLTKKIITKYKNKLKFKNDIGLNLIKSNIHVKTIFDTIRQKNKILFINSNGQFSSNIKDEKIDDFIKFNSDLNGDYNFYFNNNKSELTLEGKFKNSKFNFFKIGETLNLSEIQYLLNYKDDKLIIDKLNFIKNNSTVLDAKAVFIDKNQNLNFTDLKININNFPAKIFNYIYFTKFEGNNKFFTFDSGTVVNSKIYLKNKNFTGHDPVNKVQILDFNFKNLTNNKHNIKFDHLSLTRNNDQIFFGNSKFYYKNILFNSNFELDSNGNIKAFGTIFQNMTLNNIIFNKFSFKIKNGNPLKFETLGNINKKDYEVKIRSNLKNASIFHKVLNLNESKIKKGNINFDLIFKNAELKSIHNFLMNYDDNQLQFNFDFKEYNFIEITNLLSKNFNAKSVVIQKTKQKMDIKIDGDSIDISHLTKDLLSKNNSQNYNIKFDIISNQIILNENLSLSGSLNGSLKKSKFSSIAKGKIVLSSNTLLDAGQLNILVNKNEYVLEGKGALNGGQTYVKIVSSENGLPIVTFDTKEGGKLLSALRFTDKVKSGVVKLKIKFIDKSLSKYEGFINAKNFKIINAPKIIKSLSSLSFSGINSLFVGEGVGFKDGYAKFFKNGDNFNFNKILINNETLSVYLEGIYNTKNQKINFTGSIAPFSQVSRIISVVPAVGELLTGLNKKGVISGQFKLSEMITDPKIDLNILSFSPGILRQIFSKNWLKEN